MSSFRALRSVHVMGLRRLLRFLRGVCDAGGRFLAGVVLPLRGAGLEVVGSSTSVVGLATRTEAWQRLRRGNQQSPSTRPRRIHHEMGLVQHTAWGAHCSMKPCLPTHPDLRPHPKRTKQCASSTHSCGRGAAVARDGRPSRSREFPTMCAAGRNAMAAGSGAR